VAEGGLLFTGLCKADSVRVLVWNRPKPVIGVIDAEHPGREDIENNDTPNPKP
jgi:hypothetical protein